MVKKLFFVAVLAGGCFFSTNLSAICTLDSSGKGECETTRDSSGNIISEKCGTSALIVPTNRCVPQDEGFDPE